MLFFKIKGCVSFVFDCCFKMKTDKMGDLFSVITKMPCQRVEDANHIHFLLGNALKLSNQALYHLDLIWKVIEENMLIQKWHAVVKCPYQLANKWETIMLFLRNLAIVKLEFGQNLMQKWIVYWFFCKL